MLLLPTIERREKRMNYLRIGSIALFFSIAVLLLLAPRGFAQTEPDETPTPPATMPERPGLIPQPSDAVISSEFIFRKAPFPSCHAATIVETKTGLLAAWFGGTRERAPDVGIWVSRYDGSKWSDLVEVANGIQ